MAWALTLVHLLLSDSVIGIQLLLYKMGIMGTSLVVHWLRFYTSSADIQCRIFSTKYPVDIQFLVKELKSHMSQDMGKNEILKGLQMLERVWRKGNPLTLLVGMQTGTATMENSVEIS